MVLAYVISSTFLANVSPDAMLHRTFILLMNSKGGEQYTHMCSYACV